MTEESALAPEAGPETAVTAPEQAQTEGQTTEGQAAEAEPKAEEQKSEAAKRRERDKAQRERLRQEAEDNRRKAEEAEARKRRIIEAGEQSRPPEEKDFPDYTEYVAAKAVWRAAQQQDQRAAREAEEQAQAARRAAEQAEAYDRQITAQAFQAQVEEAKTRYADFEAVVYAPHVPITDDMVAVIQSSDVGADLAYHLGKNPALAARIAKMRPIEAARELGRIEATLTRPQARTQTQAPDPINPVRGKAAGAKDPTKMTQDEWNAFRDAGGTFS
jgi:multidrug efflux pump subunit AcrA (membrane-fusion protein)